MKTSTIQIFLVQENAEYPALLQRQLETEKSFSFQLQNKKTLQAAQEYLSTGQPDIIFLELSLPDSRGVETFEKIQQAAPQVPIVILASLEDELQALRAVEKGAHDYLLKNQEEGALLLRVLRCTLERHRVRQELLNLSVTDELTGLYNRRGFSVLAEQQIKLARRSKQGFLLMVMDLDQFKQVNDLHGHLEGDAALHQTGELLRKTFRESDVIARMGGDEFSVLAIDAKPETIETIYRRLEEVFDQCNLAKKRPYKLALSAGAAYFNPETPLSFEQLFETADHKLYEHKRSKSHSNS